MLRSWGYVGDILDHPGLKGCPWVHVGPMLAYVGSMLALCWPMSALSWPMLALSWPYVGPTLAYVGLCWPHVGPSWGLCWGYVGDTWDHLCWKTSKTRLESSELQLASLQNLGLAAPKLHGTKVRTKPSTDGCECLMSLSEATRISSSKFQLASPQNLGFTAP